MAGKRARNPRRGRGGSGKRSEQSSRRFVLSRRQFLFGSGVGVFLALAEASGITHFIPDIWERDDTESDPISLLNRSLPQSELRTHLMGTLETLYRGDETEISGQQVPITGTSYIVQTIPPDSNFMLLGEGALVGTDVHEENRPNLIEDTEINGNIDFLFTREERERIGPEGMNLSIPAPAGANLTNELRPFIQAATKEDLDFLKPFAIAKEAFGLVATMALLRQLESRITPATASAFNERTGQIEDVQLTLGALQTMINSGGRVLATIDIISYVMALQAFGQDSPQVRYLLGNSDSAVPTQEAFVEPIILPEHIEDFGLEFVDYIGRHPLLLNFGHKGDFSRF